MNTLIRKRLLVRSFMLLLLCASASPAPAQAKAPKLPARSPLHFADYNSEPRSQDGHVDGDALLARLKELHVTTYYWLIWHAATDWDDLKLFLPRAARANIEIWVYLVPPTESPPLYGTSYSEPFRLDYGRWAEEIARLSLQHTNLTAWVIDDFYGNHQFFTPAVVRDLQRRGKGINPRLAFLPLMYFGEIRRQFVQDYREVIDGVVVAYPRDRTEMDHAWAILNDDAVVLPGELSFPANTPSQPGDFVEASLPARVSPLGPRRISFQERDDFTGPTAGYHFKQLLVNKTVVWEEDVAGGTNAWRRITVELPAAVPGGDESTLAFRLLDKKGVGNFGVRWQLKDLRGEGIKGTAGLDRPQKWQVTQRGPFEAGFGDRLKTPQHRFHVPFIVMTAGQAGEFKLRHGEPASPERMAEWLRFCLEAWSEGKCDGVVTYCLDKTPGSRVFDLARDLFGQYRPKR
ncbi:MAG TPA: hypothetical protein P5205_13735 [Candidatus Paceibacterota bacterium]|nr:hypothetical protein [Verrucomicrobiota bacterium]HSA11422.1 hypothetical protein [Candidatus Paceibacterota bacterium]